MIFSSFTDFEIKALSSAVKKIKYFENHFSDHSACSHAQGQAKRTFATNAALFVTIS